MKILIVHNQYQLAGGEDTVAENEGKLFREYGHEVYYYIRSNSEIQRKHVFQTFLQGIGTFFSIKSYREISVIIRKHHIDVVHVHNTVPLISCAVYYAAKKNHCKLVQSVHNMRMLCPTGMMVRDEHICEECTTKGLKCAIKYGCYRNSRLQSAILAISIGLHRFLKSYDLVDAYLVTTDFNYQMLQKVVAKEKIYMKPYYSDSDVRDCEKKTRDYYIYISRVEYLKGIFVALEAFKDMPDKKLLVLGVGPGEEKAHAYVSENQMKNVEFLGFKKKEEMLELLYNAKALVFPTQWYEGFPMTIVESLAVGTPIIGSNIGNVGTIVKDGVNGLTFQYDNSTDLAEKIQYFDEHPSEACLLEKGAQEDFVKNHTPEEIYKLTCEIYRN